MFGYLCVHVLRRKGRAIRGIAPNYRTISRTRGPSGSKYPGYSSGESPARPPAPEDDVKIGAALHRALQLLRFLSPARIAPFGGGLSGIASPLPAQARQGAGSRCLAQQNSFFFCGRAIDLLARCSSHSGQASLHHHKKIALSLVTFKQQQHQHQQQT